MTGAAPRRLWLPGRFKATNELLSMQRAEGAFHANAQRTGSWAKPRVSFSGEVAEYKRHAATMALAERVPRPFSAGLAALYFVLCHDSGRYDPAAWYLAAKAVEDGLVAAGVLGSDRFDVDDTGGICVRVGALRTLPDGLGFRSKAPGMLVLLTEVARG